MNVFGARRCAPLQWERLLWSGDSRRGHAWTARIEGWPVAVFPTPDGRWKVPCATGALTTNTLAAAKRKVETLTEHRFDYERSGCVCGGALTYFGDDKDGYRGEGCDRFGVWPVVRLRRDELVRLVGLEHARQIYRGLTDEEVTA